VCFGALICLPGKRAINAPFKLFRNFATPHSSMNAGALVRSARPVVAKIATIWNRPPPLRRGDEQINGDAIQSRLSRLAAGRMLKPLNWAPLISTPASTPDPALRHGCKPQLVIVTLICAADR
jgi:hypothetical protein